jgi:DNA repair protein RecO (recombination protein O)
VAGVPGLVAAEPGLGEPRNIEPVLRRFELSMLRELGFAVELARDVAGGAAIDPARDYWYVVERGPIPAEGAAERADAVRLSGLTLVHLDRGEFDDPCTAGEAKSLMRLLIHHCLNGQELSTRAIVRSLQRIEDAA